MKYERKGFSEDLRRLGNLTINFDNRNGSNDLNQDVDGDDHHIRQKS